MTAIKRIGPAKKSLAMLLAILMVAALFVPMSTLTATAATSPADPDTGKVETTAGTNTYSLFNSGATSSNGKYYSSTSGKDANPDSHSYNNSGYDIYGDSPRYSKLTVGMGLSFHVNQEITERATLTVYAYDVDEENGQIDNVYLVDEDTATRTLVGTLKGMNGKWTTTTLYMDANLFVKGHTYHFENDIDDGGWWTWIRTVSVSLTSSGTAVVEPTKPTILDHTFEAFFGTDGKVCTNLYVKTNQAVSYTLEYTATINNEQKGGAQNVTLSIPSTNEQWLATTFSLESGSPAGNYLISVIIKDASGNTVASYSANAGYSYSAVSYHANGGSNNLPIDNTAYSSGDTVTVLFDYIPSKSGYVFLGWATTASATAPQYTQNGTNTFTIGSSDVALYAVWEKEVHVHTESDWIVTTEPTCSTKGSAHTVCTDCGNVVSTKSLAALGHSYQPVNVVEETCTTDGYVEYACDHDGCTSTKKQILPAKGHRFEGDNVCDDCGYIRVQHTHTYTETVVAPSCTAMGYTLYECTCGDSYRGEFVDQRGHRWDEGTVTVAKTCTTDGVLTYTCETCSVTRTELLPAGHNWSETVTVAATCTTDGLTTRTCPDCNTEETQVIPAGHTWNAGTVITEATCTTPGVKECTCEACGHVEELEIPVLGHHFVDGSCTRCGATIPDIVSPDTDHPEYGMYFEIDDIISNYGPDYINEYGVLLDYNADATIKKVAVFLMQDGTMWRRCIACVGDNITYATYVPYLAHDGEILYTGLNSEWINIFRLSKNSSNIWCYSDYATIGVNLEDAQGNLLLSLYDIGQAGAKTRIFDDLDEMIKWLSEDSDCIDHVESDWIVDAEPTCGTEGSKHTECTSCGIVIREEAIPATGSHTESDWIIDPESTCTTDGRKYVECTVCGTVIREEVIPANGSHTEGEVEFRWDLVTNEGTAFWTCTVCGEVFDIETENTSEYIAGNCVTQAQTVYTATAVLNGETHTASFTEAGAYGEHTESDWIVDTEPTCATEGAKHVECTVCGAKMREETIPATGLHTESDWIVDVEPSLTTVGQKHKECLNCHAILMTERMPVTAQISVEHVSAGSGTTVDVTVDIQNNPGVMGAVLTLHYDPALTLLNAKAGSAWSSLNLTMPATLTNSCSFVWDGVSEDAANGTLLVLTFAVPADAVGSVYSIGVSYTEGNLLNSALENVDVVIVDGSITITELIGDVNDDGIVDVVDVITLRRYIAGGYGVSINQTQADMNKDGEITVADVILLRRYISDGTLTF